MACGLAVSCLLRTECLKPGRHHAASLHADSLPYVTDPDSAAGRIFVHRVRDVSNNTNVLSAAFEKELLESNGSACVVRRRQNHPTLQVCIGTLSSVQTLALYLQQRMCAKSALSPTLTGLQW